MNWMIKFDKYGNFYCQHCNGLISYIHIAEMECHQCGENPTTTIRNAAWEPPDSERRTKHLNVLAILLSREIVNQNKRLNIVLDRCRTMEQHIKSVLEYTEE